MAQKPDLQTVQVRVHGTPYVRGEAFNFVTQAKLPRRG